MSLAAAVALLRPSPRQVALSALCERRLADGFFARAAKWYGWGIAFSYGLALAFEAADARPVVARALGTLAWIAGGILGLSAARMPAFEHGADGITSLARQHGLGARALERARFAGTARRIARVTTFPGLALVGLSAWVADSGADLARAVAWAFAVVIFAGSLAVAVAALARGAALLAPGRGRLVFAAGVLLPHAARSVWPSVPSLPSLLGAWLDLLLAVDFR